jgi:SAM-dependent methyltransferase
LSGTGSIARYDGHAEWYDHTFASSGVGEEAVFLRDSLGAGDGQLCLDVACGTGFSGQVVAKAGYQSVGIDISWDQLRLARHRLGAIVQADATHLPLRDGAIELAISLYFHTDVEDFATVVREVARCLAHGGRFIYLGLHPCFIGPFIDRQDEDRRGQLSIVAGYGQMGWSHIGSGGKVGLWSRVGGHHKTLAYFVEAFTGASLIIRTMREFSGVGTLVPRNIGVIAEKAAGAG